MVFSRLFDLAGLQSRHAIHWHVFVLHACNTLPILSRVNGSNTLMHRSCVRSKGVRERGECTVVLCNPFLAISTPLLGWNADTACFGATSGWALVHLPLPHPRRTLPSSPKHRALS